MSPLFCPSCDHKIYWSRHHTDIDPREDQSNLKPGDEWWNSRGKFVLTIDREWIRIGPVGGGA